MTVHEGKLTDEEKWWWDKIRPLVAVGYHVYVGLRQRRNPLPCPDTTATFEFGDIRIETPTRTLVIEIEGTRQGASLVNILKYWPWLKGDTANPPTKPVTIFHIWNTSWPTHKVLWRKLKSEVFDPAPFVVSAEIIPFPLGREELESVIFSLRNYLSTERDGINNR